MAKATLRIPDRLWRKVRGLAGASGMSANRYLEDLIRRTLEDKPDPPEKGRKGGIRYPTGGSPAMRTCDRSGS